MNYKKYLEMICEGDIVGVRAKMQAKQRGLTHQSHNIWKDKQGNEFKWDDQGKKFENINKKTVEIISRTSIGSQLYKTLTEDQNKKIIEKLRSLKNPKIKEILKQAKNKEDYSEDLVVKYNNVRFSVYAANGRFRIGGGGRLSSGLLLDQKLNIDDFIESI